MSNTTFIKKRISVLVQVLLCIFIFLFPLYMMSRSGDIDLKYYFVFLIRTSILIALFYINYLFLVDKYLFKKEFTAYISINIVLITVLLFIQYTVIEFFLSADFPPPPEPDTIVNEFRRKGPPPILRYWGDLGFVILVISLSVALKATQRWYNDSIKMEQAKTIQLEADLRNLRNQLNPHFLFNTLNNIYSLIAIDSVKAQDSVHRLSNLLRYVLYENNTQLVPIGSDIEFTQNYIDLMKLRIGPNTKMDVSIINSGSKDVIAPLMFMTIIENAFKHGSSDSESSYIGINIIVENGKGVLCTVKNSLGQRDNIEGKNSGIGLPNLSKRLELIYPGRHDLVINKSPDSYTVQLRIDFGIQKIREEI